MALDHAAYLALGRLGSSELDPEPLAHRLAALPDCLKAIHTWAKAERAAAVPVDVHDVSVVDE